MLITPALGRHLATRAPLIRAVNDPLAAVWPMLRQDFSLTVHVAGLVADPPCRCARGGGAMAAAGVDGVVSCAGHCDCTCPGQPAATACGRIPICTPISV